MLFDSEDALDEHWDQAEDVYTSPDTVGTGIPTDEFGQVGNTGSQQLAFGVTVRPGLEVPPGPIMFRGSGHPNNTEGIGIVASAAETDPVIAIKSIEIKYQLEVSYDG